MRLARLWASLGSVGAVLSLVLAGAPGVAAQDQFVASVNGFVTDARSGETLILANVAIEGTGRGTATNTSGFYTLAGLRPGTYTLSFSYIGYEEARREVTIAEGKAVRLDVALSVDDVVIGELVVTADRAMYDDIKRIGVASLEAELVKKLPAVLEPDVFRSLQLLPGVKAASDFSSGLYIRGGSPDQTLILLDRTSVYNPSHFFGLFSTFNPDAIKDVRLFKGGYPAEYGGRLGSVVDIYNKDGNRLETQGSVSVGLLASRVLLEGPYRWGSWMVAARRSTLDPLLSALNKADIENIPESFYFYDLNGKVNFDATGNDRFSLSFYAGQDDLKFPFLDDAELLLNYGNRTVSANWTHVSGGRLFSNVTGTYSTYESEPLITLAGTGIKRQNRITDLSVKADFDYFASDRHTLKVGAWAGNLLFRLTDSFDDIETLNSRIQSAYASAYVQETFRPTAEWSLQGGLRANYFGDGDYLRFEPRLTVEYQPYDHIRFQTGYGRYYQFLTLITSEAFAGFDVWLTTNDGVPPAFGDQWIAGVKSRLTPDINLDVELYTRSMDGLFQLDPFLNDPSGFEYKDVFVFGEGYAYGGEVLLEKPRGRINGFLGYTYGITRRKFPNINLDDAGIPRFYAPKYDRTHDVSAVANYDLSRRWRFTGVFSYGTGQAYTQPTGQYRLVRDPFGAETREVLIAPFNGSRLRPYHRLDIGLSNVGRFFGIGRYEFQFQVINVYSRKNIWFIFNEFEEDGGITLTEVPQIPFPIPNLSFTLRF